MKDVIAAIATPVGRGAIGIIRISGLGSLEILGKLWKSRVGPVENFVSHRIYLGKIASLSTGKTIDKVLASYMKAPNSYTGEDIVEISCHGSGVVLKSILDEIISAGARLAEPGEFTKRAFLNGKMDLAQAEGVAALIDSTSKRGAEIAEMHLEGRLSREIRSISDQLSEILAFVEASIDFPEEDIDFIKGSGIENKTKNISDNLDSLIKTFDYGQILSEGIKVVLAGPPNAGKSSLLNAFLGRERAIVHSKPGTTRDTIEEELNLEGITFRFIDTAGIREAEEEVEEIGVEKSRKEAIRAEVLLLVLDGNSYHEISEPFYNEIKDIKHLFVIINKSDLGINLDKTSIETKYHDRPIFFISAAKGEGLQELRKALVKEFSLTKDSVDTESVIITSRRHLQALIMAKENLNKAKASIKKAESSEFAAHHLRRSLDSLGEIIGLVTPTDILNKIFSNFCIGK